LPRTDRPVLHRPIRVGAVMNKVTIGLLSAAYACLALALAVYVARAGGGWGAGVSALVGGLGLALAIHGNLRRHLDASNSETLVLSLRRANMIIAEQMFRLGRSMSEVTVNVKQDAARRSDELTSEVRVLESLVQRMSDGLDEGLVATSLVGAAAEQKNAALMFDTVREALTENRVDLYLQPVVGLPQRKTVFYESFSRLRDATGRVIMPAEYLRVAEPGGLVGAIDNLLLFRCVQIVRRLAKQDRKVGIFCNIALASLDDEAFFPQFLEFMSENRDLSSRLIFELGQASFEARSATAARNMAQLADLGFRFSLDKVVNLDLDFQNLSRADIKYLKISAPTLLSELLSLDGRPALRSLRHLNAADFADLTRRYGLEIIAEKVETENEVIDVLELNIVYGQGNLFGEPRPIRDSLLNETDPPPGFMRGSLRRAMTR
jgi:cyclic-di-GMP phosphodiesterase TipF (flagellum assembly factor)